jgi:predicted transcriptional regulator of viral defense system
MVESGELDCVERGVYRSPNLGGDETAMRIAEIASRHPKALFCLMSASRFHRLTDDMHADWSIAMPTRSSLQIAAGVRLHRWMSDKSYSIGIETVRIAGVDVPMTSPSRTVADMIRKRNGQASEHALGAYAAFLAAGGEPEEVSEHARKLGFANEVAAITPFARRMLDSGAFEARPQP